MAGPCRPSTSTSMTAAPENMPTCRSIGRRRHDLEPAQRATVSTGHEEPALDENQLRLLSRSRTAARRSPTDVVVKGYHCKPSAGVLWPNDLQGLHHGATLRRDAVRQPTTPGKDRRPVQLDSGRRTITGHDCMLMIVSAERRRQQCRQIERWARSYEDWRLVPNDNNVGQRNVKLVPGGRRLDGPGREP